MTDVVGEDRVVDVDHARALPEDVVQEPERGCPTHGFGSALFCRIRGTPAEDGSAGLLESAAAPATCGDAMEVPEIEA